MPSGVAIGGLLRGILSRPRAAGLPGLVRHPLGRPLHHRCARAIVGAVAGNALASAIFTWRSYLGHTRRLGVYEPALPGSVSIAVISSPLGETNMSKVGPPPSTA